jgi:hypothetical protein
MKRKPARLSDSLSHRLNSYALAASAAGVGVLAIAQPAEAKIIYTPAHHIIGRNESYKFHIVHSKITTLTLVNTAGCNTYYCHDALFAFPATGNGVVGSSGSVAYALVSGSQIGSKQPFFARQALMESTSGSMGAFGFWDNVNNGYLGIRFNLNNKTHYGWARLNVQLPGHRLVRATLTGYAYETIPNKAIVAGKTKGPDVETVEPVSLGHLARGAR